MTKELCTRTDLAPDETDSSCGEYSEYVDGFTIRGDPSGTCFLCLGLAHRRT